MYGSEQGAGVEPRELRCELLKNPISPIRMRLKIIRSLVGFGADRLTLSSLVQHPMYQAFRLVHGSPEDDIYIHMIMAHWVSRHPDENWIFSQRQC